MQKQIKFGTDGIRGKADKFPFLQEPLTLLGVAIAQWSIKKYKNQNPRILIGHDTRISCEPIKQSLKKGFMSLPLTVIDAQVLPTPAVCKLIKNKQCDFGIVISASHNLYQDNGIKIFDSKKNKISKTDENSIIKNFENLQKINQKIILNKNASDQIWLDTDTTYINEILPFFNKNFLKGLKIVLDCANGATYKIAPIIFKELGASIIDISTKPDGKNINHKCGALHLEQLKKTVINQKADIGFAFDGDGDRVMAVNKLGKIKDGDDILALLCNHPKLKDTNKIVGTIMTNLGLELFLKKTNKSLTRTHVGDKYVAEKLEKNNLLLGGESSGHIIMKDYMNTGDGIFNALRTLEVIILNNNWELKTFKKTPQFLINVPVLNKKDLTTLPYSKVIVEHKKLLKNGRIVVRYSGTENLLRVMTEGPQKDITLKTAQNLTKQLEKMLNESFTNNQV